MTNVALAHARKARMLEKTKDYFTKYENYMLLHIQKVQSNQYKEIIAELPSNFRVLFAKNKIIKKVLRELDEEKYRDLIGMIKGNVIIAFFDGMDPREVLSVSEKHVRKAHASAGDFTKKDILVPAGPTGIAPEKISLFQAAKMSTKINKGKIEVAAEHVMVKAGEFVGIAEANLLHMLNVMPFEFGMDILQVFEGSETYSKEVLLIDEECIEKAISEAAASVAAMSLGLGITTEASVVYEMSSAISDVKKLALGLGISLNSN